MTIGRDGYFVLPGVGKKFERDPDRPVLVKASGEDTGGLLYLRKPSGQAAEARFTCIVTVTN